MSLFQKKKRQGFSYDPTLQEPVVRRSVCTGEMTLGLVDLDTGKFHELRLVENQKELEDICRSLGVETLRTIY